MTHVPKHHRKQEGEGYYGVHRCGCVQKGTGQVKDRRGQIMYFLEVHSPTWINFTVVCHTISINNVLKASCERVERKQRRWRRRGCQPVVERIDRAATFPLVRQIKQKQTGGIYNYFYPAAPHLCCLLLTYPSLSESALQFWQLGCGTPGFSNQAFVCDWRAAEVEHHLDRLTLLHAHLPLWQHSHRSIQQLLQVGLSLWKHLVQREVIVNIRATCRWIAHLLKVI